jgi:DNA-binding PadR family transcriptional regulator
VQSWSGRSKAPAAPARKGRRAAKRLTPTSYALLGLIAVRPRSAYDLIAQLKRSTIRLVWPGAESRLYEEPKTLVAHGLVSARAERSRRRRRTVYHVTPRGRRALRRWLDEPGAGLLLEFESMIKVVYGDFGSRDQLLRNLRRIRDGVARRSGLGLALARELADTGPQEPGRAHINAITDRFVVEIMQTTLRWSEWATKIVERWPDTSMNESTAAEARALLRENAERIEAMAAAAPAAIDGPPATAAADVGLRS